MLLQTVEAGIQQRIRYSDPVKPISISRLADELLEAVRFLERNRDKPSKWEAKHMIGGKFIDAARDGAFASAPFTQLANLMVKASTEQAANIAIDWLVEAGQLEVPADPIQLIQSVRDCIFRIAAPKPPEKTTTPNTSGWLTVTEAERNAKEDAAAISQECGKTKSKIKFHGEGKNRLIEPKSLVHCHAFKLG